MATAPAPSIKKSFFKKPNWATSAPPTESRDFFRHSDTVYDSILREKEKRRERHAQQKQATAGLDDEDSDRESKRRRILTDEENQKEDSYSDSETASVERREQDTATTGHLKTRAESPARRGPIQAGRASPTYLESSLNPTTLVHSNVIELDFDKENNQHQPVTPERKVQARLSDEEVSEEEDEYVLALKQKAREKARLKKLGIEPARKQEPALPALEAQQLRHLPSGDEPTFFPQRAVPTPPPQRDETIVQIFIDTEIPNAKPLIVNRKVSQPMQQVRAVWCARQNFTDDITAQVIFTWRGKRLYDTTTSTHLLNVLKIERARQLGGLAGDDDEDPSNGRIEVVAMTKDMYEQKQNKNDAEADANSITDPTLQDRKSQARSATPEPKYTIVMNAQGLEPLQLKVRPSTPVAKMMAGFKKLRQIDSAKTCWLVHDGDRLEPESLVRDTEIEDGDAVEVHVR
ncbi:hypothetical protein GJ744_002491 [Endocarpon pusillum]|uniref:Rad60/SUMO-like domain-containing protein n=1 Tax=Endocarpon pusillum TaxID=364733 RepID=A0A8H7AAR4_9EURO|nr:hypothetical protein GJ744_002491 [Endocarpon pusillum]